MQISIQLIPNLPGREPGISDLSGFRISSEDFEASSSVRCLGRAVKYKESLPHLPNAACVANSPENTALRGRTEAL